MFLDLALFVLSWPGPGMTQGEAMHALWALTVLLIYLVPFFTIGWVGRWVIRRWMDAKGLDLSGPPELGRGGGKRQLFLLGIWRKEPGP